MGFVWSLCLKPSTANTGLISHESVVSWQSSFCSSLLMMLWWDHGLKNRDSSWY
uniref:Uncharacterized protein n=1 Tax=Anguilla anguilla TaxID=7936 RepID=A0A0E9WSL1_ANGAN